MYEVCIEDVGSQSDDQVQGMDEERRSQENMNASRSASAGRSNSRNGSRSVASGSAGSRSPSRSHSNRNYSRSNSSRSNSRSRSRSGSRSEDRSRRDRSSHRSRSGHRSGYRRDGDKVFASNPDHCSLLVKGFKHRVERSDLEPVFGEFGKVCDVHIPRDYYTHQQRGFAFIEFESREIAENAMQQLDNKDVCGDRVTITIAKNNRKSSNEMRRIYAESRRDRSRSGSRGHYRHSHRDRSYSRDRYYRDRSYSRDRYNRRDRYDSRSHSRRRY